MQKRIVVIGAFNMAGIAKQSKNEYSMFKIITMEPILIERNIVNAQGYKPREFDCEEQAFNQLRDLRGQFPMEVEAFLEMNNKNTVQIQSIRPIGEDKTDIPLKSAGASK